MESNFAASIKSFTNLTNSLISQLQQENDNHQLFYKQIEAWRNLQVNYMLKITQIANNLKEKTKIIRQKQNGKQITKQNLKSSVHSAKNQDGQIFHINLECSKVLQMVIECHKSLISNVNSDIFAINYEHAAKLSKENQRIVNEQKKIERQLLNKKQSMDKVLSKKYKLKKSKEEQLMCQIFMEDSVNKTMDLKIRQQSKIKEIEKEQAQFEIKVKETSQQFKKVYQLNKAGVQKMKMHLRERNRCNSETLMKLQIHFNNHWKSLLSHIDHLTSVEKYEECHMKSHLFSKIDAKVTQIQKHFEYEHPGFMENILKIINENSIDDLIEYSKDKDIKIKIKRMMESNDVNPTETDESCRQIKLIKKMLAQESFDSQCIKIFRNIINKNSKLRMNFVFILQFFRINNQFEINADKIHSLVCIISQFLEVCYKNRDSFVLKQLMVLLMTYYVSHSKEQKDDIKIYIIHFFNKHQCWRDLSYWQSILVQCIYTEKKNTFRMMIVNESGNLSRKKQLLEAQRLAILNQMLMVLRNMAIFQFSQKQLKSFAAKFIKLLKQDELFQKDVFSMIQSAVKEEVKQLQAQKKSIKQYYSQNLVKLSHQNTSSYTMPLNIRKSYIF